MRSASLSCLVSLTLKLSNVNKLAVRDVLSFKKWRNHAVGSLPVYGHALSNTILKSIYPLVSKIHPATLICCCKKMQHILIWPVCSGDGVLFFLNVNYGIVGYFGFLFACDTSETESYGRNNSYNKQSFKPLLCIHGC